MTDGPARHRVVIVGGGVGGLDLATGLGRRPDLAVSLIDAATQHVWKPMLHGIAAGTETPALAGVPYLAQAARHGFAYVPGRATAIDLDARTATVDRFVWHDAPLLPERTLAWDTLVLATGSVADDFGVPGVADHAHRIDTLAEALAFRHLVRPRIAAAAAAGHRLTVAIVGGGATGVQLAAELLQLADDYDAMGVGGARRALDVVLVDRGPRLVPAFPERVSEAALARLRGLGVTVRLSVEVAGAGAEGLQLADGTAGGGAIPADILVWAAGVKAALPIAGLDALDRGRMGRIAVDDRCRTGRPDVFAIGDCAECAPAGGEGPLPPTAQAAYQQAVWLGRRLPAMLAGRTVPPFHYRDYGVLVALGGYDAYGALGRFGVFGRGFIRGRVAQAGHALLYRRHQFRLHGLWRTALLWIADLARGAART